VQSISLDFELIGQIVSVMSLKKMLKSVKYVNLNFLIDKDLKELFTDPSARTFKKVLAGPS